MCFRGVFDGQVTITGVHATAGPAGEISRLGAMPFARSYIGMSTCFNNHKGILTKQRRMKNHFRSPCLLIALSPSPSLSHFISRYPHTLFSPSLSIYKLCLSIFCIPLPFPLSSLSLYRFSLLLLLFRSNICNLLSLHSTCLSVYLSPRLVPTPPQYLSLSFSFCRLPKP